MGSIRFGKINVYAIVLKPPFCKKEVSVQLSIVSFIYGGFPFV